MLFRSGGELGATCTTCHSPATFRLAAFTHTRSQVVTGLHFTLACDACHKPAVLAGSSRAVMGGGRFRATPTDCASCHADVHLGQVSADCSTCHSVSAARFAPDRFAHDRSSFRLTGAHVPVSCARCHLKTTGTFPTGPGTATRLTGVASSCKSCHEDVHLGQVSQNCETCHSTESFLIKTYVHQQKRPTFFTGPHLEAACSSCHKAVTAKFPTGHGTALQFHVGTDCIGCHEDVHHGSMGRDCAECHTVTTLTRTRTPMTMSPVVHVRARVGAWR